MEGSALDSAQSENRRKDGGKGAGKNGGASSIDAGSFGGNASGGTNPSGGSSSGGLTSGGSTGAGGATGGGGSSGSGGTAGSGSGGWTAFTPSSDTQTIYVSNSSGNDANTGLSQSAPVKTIAQGMSLLRAGFPDWLLLKKGDVWKDEAIGYLCDQYGRSPSEPMLISSYGSGPRPLIKTNPSINEAAIGAFNHSSGGCPNAANNLALVGLEFYAYTRDPASPDFDASTIALESSGMRFVRPVSSFLVEDCKFSFYQGSGFDTDGAQNVSLRRNIIVDSYSTTGHSQGLYVAGVTNLVIDENVFDHNGWNASISGAEPTIFNHNIYLQVLSDPATVKGNTIANASSHGLQQRSGGATTNNLFAHNPIGMEYGSTETAEYGPMQHDGTATNNVFLEGYDIGPENPRGWGIIVYPDAAGVKVLLTDNIIAHVASSAPYGFGIGFESGATGGTATNNIICQWDDPIHDDNGSNVISPNTTNASTCDGLGPDPNRTIETYDKSLGGPGTLAHFLTLARAQSKDNWNPALTAAAVNAYIRAGFGK